MGLLDDLITRGLFPGASGGPAAPPAGLLNLNPEDQQDLIIDPMTGVAVRSGIARKPQWPAMRPTGPAPMQASAPLVPSPVFGSLAPAMPQEQPQETPAAPQSAEAVPLPKPRPTAADEGDDDEEDLPKNAAPTEGKPTTASLDGGSSGPSFIERIGKGLSDNSNTLLSLAAGFAGAPSIGTGMSRAFSNAVTGSQLDQKQLLQRQQILSGNLTAQALMKKGATAEEAASAIGNPTMMKAMIDKYFAPTKYEFKTEKDAMGQERVRAYDPYTGKPVEGAAGDNANPAGQQSIFAPGVTAIDENKTGDEYLGQYSPAIQASVKAYVNGDTMPSTRAGNMQFIKTLAQRYGADTGTPVSDALYAEKRKYRTELGSNSASSAGGQAKAFSQALEHFSAAADAAEKLGNYNGLGVTDLAHAANSVRGHSTEQADKVNKMMSIIQQGSGEVGKLFSGSQGGGVHERQATRERFSGTASNPELAGAFEGTLETLEGGLRALEGRRDQILGPNSDVQFLGPKEQAKIDHIKEVIGRLRGEQAAPAAQPSVPGMNVSKSGIPWRIVQ